MGCALGTPLILARVLTLALAALAFLLSPAAAKPTRIVSMNLCVDQLVLLLAKRENIASLSYAAEDEGMSYLAPLAKGIPRNYGRAEEILPLQPDLVLAGSFTSRPTVEMLRHLGYKVVDVPDALSLNDIRDAITLVASEVGEEARGAEVLATFDAALAATAAPLDQPRPVASFLSLGLYSFGKGTLIGDLLQHTGFDNLQDRLGLAPIGPITLEALVSNPPDALILGSEGNGDDSLSLSLLKHPAIRDLAKSRPTLGLTGMTWVCGAPVVTEVAAALAKLRQDIHP